MHPPKIELGYVYADSINNSKMGSLCKKIEKNEPILKEDLQRVKKEKDLKEENQLIESLVKDVTGVIINMAPVKTKCFVDMLHALRDKSEAKQKELIDSIISRLQLRFPDILIKHEVQRDMRNGRMINSAIVANWE
jgi:hypothetical protein